jgi:hypothetical protein
MWPFLFLELGHRKSDLLLKVKRRPIYLYPPPPVAPNVIFPKAPTGRYYLLKPSKKPGIWPKNRPIFQKMIGTHLSVCKHWHSVSCFLCRLTHFL